MHRTSISIALASFVLVAACGASSQGNGFGGDGGGGGGKDGGKDATQLGGDGGGFGNDSGGGGGGDGGGGAPAMIDDCPGMLPAATVTALQAGGPVDPAMKWLYPYDATVFAGGLLPPVLQWAPQAGGADAVYLHMHSGSFDYKGCFGPTTPQQLSPSAAAWTAAFAKSQGAMDPLHVELTTKAGSTVSGPITETWTFALGTLKGSVYYNTYTSPQVSNNGAVMRIDPGAAMPTAFLTISGSSPTGPCISCHSLSADGSMLVAQRHFYPVGLLQSESYNLVSTPMPDPAMPLATDKMDDWGFSALYPDGSRLLTDAAPGMTGGLFPAGPNANPGMIGPKTAAMFNPTTGAVIPTTGLTLMYPQMPMFSPDGTKIVFNAYDTGMGHSLAVMDFDAPTNTFSNLQTLYTDPTNYVGWPFFTPDSKWVVFALGSSSNYASLIAPPSPGTGTSDLYIIDLATKTAHSLDAANGYNGTTSYLPYPGRDEHLGFYPTVSPVAAGGYFWVFFTSRRNYGNTIAGSVDDAKSKKIWVSAINIGAMPGTDPSHAAFYLPGQELASGNIRAFATLAPCKGNGQSCMSGVDCCGGFCTGGMCGMAMGCANVDEKCTTSADCCNASLQCIGGFCATTVQ